MKNIKNILYLIVFPIVLLFGNALRAQETAVQQITYDDIPNYKMEFGLSIMPTFGSINMKTYNGGTAIGETSRGFGFGASLARDFTTHIGMDAEVIYNSFSKTYQDNYLKREVNINYTDVPLLFSLSTNKSIPVSFNIVFGPQVGFNSGSNTRILARLRTSENDTLQGVLSMKPVDIDFAYGAGLAFAFSKLQTMHVCIGFRGAYGLTTINNNNKTSSPGSYYILDNTNIKTYSGYASLIFAF